MALAVDERDVAGLLGELRWREHTNTVQGKERPIMFKQTPAHGPKKSHSVKDKQLGFVLIVVFADEPPPRPG